MKESADTPRKPAGAGHHAADPHGAGAERTAGGLRPPRPALGIPLLPTGRYALPDGNPCDGCDHCCRYVSLPIPRPRTRRDFDEIRWYVLHQGVSVYVDREGDWMIQFDSPCAWLQDGRCAHYELRPQICRDYDPAECERYVPAPAEKVLIRTEADLDRYLEEREERLAARRKRRRSAAPRSAALLLGVALLSAALASPAGAQAPGAREGLHTGPRVKRDHEIAWRPWGPAAFAEAKRLDRLVFLDITAVWCHWCHVMDETSYSDSNVIYLLNTGFIPIRVDSDRYPQVRDRYVTGGWPTTAVLTSGGQVLDSRTYVGPTDLRRMLSSIRELYQKNRRDIERKATEDERKVAATWRTDEPDTLGAASGETIVSRTLDVLRDSEDRVHGGFGDAPKFHNPDAVELLLREARARHDPQLRASALRAVDAALALEDSVWGGFYRYAVTADWKAAHYEKLLDGNAAMLRSLADAYRTTGDRRYRDAARRTARYAGAWLADRRRGGWFGSQDADVGSQDVRARYTAGEDYYNLGERLRKTLGYPHVDSTFYTDANARMASAVIAAVRTGALPEGELASARSALDRIWKELREPDGSFAHAWIGGRRWNPGLLGDEAAAGLAFLDAAQVTGDTLYLDRARAVSRWMHAHLEDSTSGGFRYAPLDSTSIGRAKAGERPPAGNLDAGLFLLRLSWLTDDPAARASAGRVMAWLRSGETLVADPATALLAERLAGTPIRIAVVGGGGNTVARELREAAFRTDFPDVVVRLYDSGGPAARWGGVELPRKPSPALYLCGERSCAPPITNPDDVDRKIEEFLTSGYR